MYDAVSYNDKCNWENGESNNDGINDNLSWNCGAEGYTDDPVINALRQRQIRNYAVLLILSMGVPMIVGGDEFGRTQRGNNNAYCQDNEVSWFDWDQISQNAEMIRFWSQLIKKRQMYLHHFRGHFYGTRRNKYGVSEISWHGAIRNQPEWDNPDSCCLAFTIGDVEQTSDHTLNIHVMMNMNMEPVLFEIPQFDGLDWRRSIDTSLPSPFDIDDTNNKVPVDSTYLVTGHSIVTLITTPSVIA